MSIWQSDGFQHPDVVLVDGRFRVGCALATAFNIKRPVTLLFDDYLHRPRMRAAEEFLKAPKFVGRMAIFDVEPLEIPVDRLVRVIRFFDNSLVESFTPMLCGSLGAMLNFEV
ncbi:hypothetical protein [Ruegeria sp.]|uniref:hypothetical protein n=1 Tax=Ruegeria sp. TaxID=1879320 RepID=UPI003B0030E7